MVGPEKLSFIIMGFVRYVKTKNGPIEIFMHYLYTLNMSFKDGVFAFGICSLIKFHCIWWWVLKILITYIAWLNKQACFLNYTAHYVILGNMDETIKLHGYHNFDYYQHYNWWVITTVDFSDCRKQFFFNIHRKHNSVWRPWPSG